MSFFDDVFSKILGSGGGAPGGAAPTGEPSTAQKILGPLFGVTFTPQAPPPPGDDPNKAAFIGPRRQFQPPGQPDTPLPEVGSVPAPQMSPNIMASLNNSIQRPALGANLAQILPFLGGR